VTGLGLAGAAAGAAALSLAGEGGNDEGPPAAASTPSPSAAAAKPADVDEISRHASEMPDSADYTLYDEGRYQNKAARSGPITQEVHFYIREVVAEIVPGATMEFWTFDGKIPGPMVRARVGDTIDFHLHNPEGNSLPHNVDFHAVTGPGGGAARLHTAVGADSNIQVKLLNPGIYIYHCAFPDIPTHLAHGMYGLIVVEPEGGLPPVDHEYYIVQSEFYTDRGGRLSATDFRDGGHLQFSLEEAHLESPTFVVFNGRPDALMGERALGVFGGKRVTTGQTVRMFVGNAGPNLVSSFHVIGEIFDRVYVEGSFDLTNRNVQSTLVPAGGSVGVEFAVEVPGDYTLVDHSLFRVHKGAIGSLHVEGEERPDIFRPIRFSEELAGGGYQGH
jgi:nitrite reductase (NO-forming)